MIKRVHNQKLKRRTNLLLKQFESSSLIYHINSLILLSCLPQRLILRTNKAITKFFQGCGLLCLVDLRGIKIPEC